jgi:hypothetical protein
MAWILFVILQAIFIGAGIRNEQRAGLWSWSKFAFALGFAALEVTILIGPIVLINVKSPWFMPIFIAAWIVAALNFIWMIIVARRWKLPDGRTSLQAYRDGQKEK